MRFLRKEPSGVDGSLQPVFKANEDELRLIHYAISKHRAVWPMLKEYQPERSRLANIQKVINRYFNDEGRSHKLCHGSHKR